MRYLRVLLVALLLALGWAGAAQAYGPIHSPNGVEAR
jgi:hypothetical protein